MQKLSMTVVMLCGTLVSGCQGGEEEQPALEQSGGPGIAASVASSSQAVVSPALAASLSCVETYVNAGTCDWAHWSEMWETCETYEHPELEDGVFLEAVQVEDCTVANWSTLRAQLLAPRTPFVSVRDSCNGESQMIYEAASNGCHSLDAAAGASFFDVPIGKSVTLHSGAHCTGDSVAVETDASLCETSFDSGAIANDNVRAFRISDIEAPSSPYRYTCADDEPTCVQNFNSRLGGINKKLTVRAVRMTLAGRATPSMDAIKRTIGNLSDHFSVASRGQVRLDLIGSQTVSVTSQNCKIAKQQARQKSNSNADLTVYVLPGGMCDTSNGGGRSVYIKGNLFRDYAHEVGHVLGLGHGNRRDSTTGKQVRSADSSTYMGKFASDNYNLPQLHWLGWTQKEELVKVNSAIDNGGSIDVTLRPVGANAHSTSSLPLGAVWEVPDTEQRLFIAVPKARTNSSNEIEGGTVFVYRGSRAVGCTGICLGTLQLARFSAKSNNEHEATGIFVKPVAYTSHFIQEDGKRIEVFSSVTLRIRR
ncbi:MULTISPECIES: hypothetical protein [Myxococcus]|nr:MULTISPECIES: hypothetical protein [Myxococcus]QZZ52677.1 hypothetical protein MyxoNM_26050 [Myxococcus xanthus]UYI12379.1 hypothetical protein N3T43_25355 [Myxococcus xanthus]UYI19747.1 hypothetical protein N1129_25805 [Myxococcus xanthus]SDX52988.1 hypothetical protein SAMN05444383_10997 [Myxococcus xanthus]